MAIQLRLTLILCSLSIIYSCNSKSKVPETASKIDERKVVEMMTNHGTITLELYNETPLHRDNFIKLIHEKAYDSLLFHRVIENFMIQGGDPDSRNAASEAVLGEGDLNYNIDAEFHPDLFHKKGALATAREETLGRVSSAMQFFIVQGSVFHDSIIDQKEKRINTMLARHYVINDSLYQPLWNALKDAADNKDRALYITINDSIDAIAKTYTDFESYTIPEAHREVYRTIGGTPHLDQNYTVFGEVIDGLNIVDSIAANKVDQNNRPINDIRIVSIHLKN